MPICGIVRRSGRKTSSTVQSKLPVPRRPVTSQLRHDFRFGAGEYPAPIERTAIRMTARLAVIADHLKAAQHPAGLPTAAAELPMPADPVAAGHRHRPPAARHYGEEAPLRSLLSPKGGGRSQK